MNPAQAFEVIEVQQGTPEWRLSRAGRVTGSEAHVIMSKENASGGETAGRKDYRLQLAVERMTGIAVDDEGFSNKWTRRGTEMEPLARVRVELATCIDFVESGFLSHLALPIGVSLDGHTKDFGTMLELKCPKMTTHLGYLRADKLPAAYRWQVVHGLYVTGAKDCYFASFNGDMPDELQLFINYVKATDLPLAEYEIELLKFLKSVVELEQELRHLQEKRRALRA